MDANEQVKTQKMGHPQFSLSPTFILYSCLIKPSRFQVLNQTHIDKTFRIRGRRFRRARDRARSSFGVGIRSLGKRGTVGAISARSNPSG